MKKRHEIVAKFGTQEFSEAYDKCASGKLADLYRKTSSVGDYFNVEVSRENILSVIEMDAIGQQVISVPVFDGLSNWRSIPNVDAQKRDSELMLSEQMQKAAKDARMFGVAGLYPVIADSAGKTIPADRSIDKVDAARVEKVLLLTETLKVSDDIIDDPNNADFGQPQVIQSGSLNIHPSRIVLVGSKKASFYKSIVCALGDYHESRRRLQIAARRNSSFALKVDVPGLQKFIGDKQAATGKKEPLEAILQTYARAAYQNLNDSNVLMLSKNDELLPFQLNVIDDLVKYVENEMTNLAGNADIPLSRLFGKTSAGLGNNAQVDFDNYSQSIDGWKAGFIDPPLRKMDNIIQIVENVDFSGWEWNPTRAEEMRLRVSGNLQVSAEKEVESDN